MKIKRKKQLNLPQLIEYAWKNDVRDSEFQTVKNERGVFYEVYFSEEGNFCSNDELDSKDLFEIEIEEEITEDTVIPKMIRIYEKDCLEDSLGYQRISIIENFSIGFELNRARSRREEIKTIHIVNEDYTHTLIWRDGELI